MKFIKMGSHIFDNCSQCDCGRKKLIVNKTHWLCTEKNQLRLDSQRSDKKAIKQPIAKKKYSVIKKTKKQSDIDKEYAKVCAQMDLESERRCSGCGMYQSGDVKLSHSHLISRSECKRIGKPELIYDKRNIVYHCMDFGEHKGCHLKWETSQRKTLLDFEKNLAFIKTVSNEVYEKYL